MHATKHLLSQTKAAYKISIGMIKQKAFLSILLMQMKYQNMEFALTTIKYGLILVSLAYTLGDGHSSNHTLEIPW